MELGSLVTLRVWALCAGRTATIMLPWFVEMLFANQPELYMHLSIIVSLQSLAAAFFRTTFDKLLGKHHQPDLL
jgi:hypothetical protein